MQIMPNQKTTVPFTADQTADTGGSDSSSSSTNSATITANDFLQLLVTEMQNQDPTADTDPNEYIDQLVQVNSLEQLVQINQDLSGSSATTGSSGSSFAPQVQSTESASPASAASANSGNLSASNPGPAASRVAGALATAAHTLAPGSSGSSLDSFLSSLRNRVRPTTTFNPAR